VRVVGGVSLVGGSGREVMMTTMMVVMMMMMTKVIPTLFRGHHGCLTILACGDVGQGHRLLRDRARTECGLWATLAS
jgi:hypothetical protein